MVKLIDCCDDQNIKKEPSKKGLPNKSLCKQYQKPIHQVEKNRYSDVMGLAIIILLGIVIYSNSFDCSFHFDDFSRIVDNPNLRNLADVKAWMNIYPSRPVGMFTFALNYYFNQLDIFYYHLVNLIIHLINTCLVWWITLLIFSSPSLKDNPIIRQKNGIALFTALLFVSHPLATQSVTYIIQRMSSLVVMFYLLSLALYVKARLIDRSLTSRNLLFVGSLISAVLAMLTKENAFTLPLAILLFELFFLRKKELSINLKDYRVILLIAIFLGLIIIILFKSSFSIFKPITPSEYNPYTVTPMNYLFTQFSVIVKYIQLLLLPINQNLDYDFPISNNFFEIRTVFSFLGLLSLLFLAIFLFKRYRIISFGIFWFFLTLSIESSFIPISDIIFEHRTYLPSFGFFLILGSGIYLMFWDKSKRLAISIFLIIVGSNAILTYERNKIWKDNLTLWSDVISKSPNKARPFANRGFTYAILGQLDNAIADFSKAIEIDPIYAKPYSNRGIVYGNLGRLDKAIADYSKAIEIDPKYTDAYFSRGSAYEKLEEWDKSIMDYSKAIEIDPKYAKAYSARGIAYSTLGQLDKAISDYSRAIEIDPKYSISYSNRGIVYSNLGQMDKAIADYSKAIEIDPKYTDAYFNRGLIYKYIKQLNKAIADFSKAIEFSPNYTKAYSNRGAAYYCLGQWDKAILDFSKAIELDPKYSTAYNSRGAAFCNLGQWDKAIADYSKVIEIDPTNTKAYSNREFAYKKLHSEKRQ